MNNTTHYAEYATSQKAQGKFLTMKICFIFLYIAVMCLIFVNPESAFALGAIAVMLDAILIFLTWRYTKPDYKYVIESGNIHFYLCYGKKEKALLETKIKDAEKIAPYSESGSEDIKNRTVYDFRGDIKTPDAYVMLFTNGAKKVAVLFEGTNKAVKEFAYYNKDTVTREDLAH